MKVYVKSSKVAGKGLFAKKSIKKGEIIGIVGGPIVPDNEEPDYLHPISHTEAIFNETITKFINHSCEPNCGLNGGIKVIALKDIKKDDEITVDYDTIEYEWEMKCNCGSKNCRKVIRGYKYLPKKLKQKYKGFISSYLLQ